MEAEVCGKCGYELVGIAQAGTCPECGRYYNLGTGQGTTQRRAPWLLRHVRTLAMVAFAAVILVCSGLISLAARNALGLVLTGLLIAGVVLLGAVVSYMSEKQEQRDAEG